MKCTLKLIVAATTCALLAQSAFAADNSTKRDEFFWLSEINKASLVINTDEGLLPKSVAGKIANGLQTVINNGNKENGARPNRVIAFEPYLIKEVGMDATMLHVGRSSQDMHATYYSAIMRDNVLAVSLKLADIMQTLNDMAKANTKTIVPNYTNGVAAQPNSYAHYLQGFLASFKRDAQRLEEFYARLNLCAMGTTVLNGTGWPLNRDRMAQYLGFDGPVPDAYDAAQMKPVDEPVEFGAILTSIALHVGSFIEDVSVQYAQPRPWIQLVKAGSTYISSAMPQKRNPGLINNCRRNAAVVISESQNVLLRIHNLNEGMPDARDNEINLEWLCDALNVIETFKGIVGGMQVSRERALEELDQDWTCTQNIADMMMIDDLFDLCFIDIVDRLRQ